MFKHGRNSSVYTEQRYGPDTTWRRNKALELRKKLKADGTMTKEYVQFPAKLYVKYDNSSPKYVLYQDFSQISIPIPVK